VYEKIFILLPLVMVGICMAQAHQEVQFESSRLSKSGRQAYQKLLDARVFRLAGVDYGGAISGEVIALRALLKEKVAVQAFKSLVDKAEPEGGLYALLGLRLKDIATYQQAVEYYKPKPEPPERPSLFVQIRIPKGQVATQTGCVISMRNRKEVLSEIESGTYDKQLRAEVKVCCDTRHNNRVNRSARSNR
jgi:hypothetical protein